MTDSPRASHTSSSASTSSAAPNVCAGLSSTAAYYRTANQLEPARSPVRYHGKAHKGPQSPRSSPDRKKSQQAGGEAPAPIAEEVETEKPPVKHATHGTQTLPMEPPKPVEDPEVAKRREKQAADTAAFAIVLLRLLRSEEADFDKLVEAHSNQEAWHISDMNELKQRVRDAEDRVLEYKSKLRDAETRASEADERAAHFFERRDSPEDDERALFQRDVAVSPAAYGGTSPMGAGSFSQPSQKPTRGADMTARVSGLQAPPSRVGQSSSFQGSPSAQAERYMDAISKPRSQTGSFIKSSPAHSHKSSQSKASDAALTRVSLGLGMPAEDKASAALSTAAAIRQQRRESNVPAFVGGGAGPGPRRNTSGSDGGSFRTPATSFHK